MNTDAIIETAEREMDVLAKENERLRTRIAELEAERPNVFREEFGVEWDDDPDVELCSSFEHARRVSRLFGGRCQTVRREVRELAAPWRAV